MKNLYLIILLVLTISIISCKKEETKDTIINETRTSMYANIDGENWQAINTECILTKSGIEISGVGQGIPAISFLIADTIPGTHMLNINSDNIGFLIDGYKQYTTYDDAFAHGSVIFTSINMVDSVISGSFNFIGHSVFNNTYSTVSDGVFLNLPLTVQLDNLSDSLIVDIDGTTFFATKISAYIQDDILAISGSDDADSLTVTIQLPFDTPVGNYSFSELGSYTGIFTTDSVWVSQTGNLIITKNNIANKHIEGTFEFEAKEFHTGDIKSFTNGLFTVDYY
jgi:hypothetical protein